MIRIPRIGGTTVFLAAWLMPWRPAFRVRAADSGLKFFVHYRDLIGRHIAKYGTHEPIPTRWLENYLGSAPRAFSSTSAPISGGTPFMPPSILRWKPWWHSSPIHLMPGCSIAI
jgi:hypothetical protein